MRPATSDEPKELKQANPPTGSLTKGEAVTLYHIASDLVSLDSLQLITHKLFYRLAQRAREELEKIDGKEASVSADQ
jgi:hypothetical protein